MQTAFEIHITGRVQGVGFRYFVLSQARALGITGYVKNNYDGSVITFAQGEPFALQQFIAELHKGPTFSRVEHVEKTPQNIRPEITQFNIRG